MDGPVVIGWCLGLIIGLGTVGGACYFFWTRAQREPARVAQELAARMGLQFEDLDGAGAELTGLLRGLHTTLRVSVGENPRIVARVGLPRHLATKLSITPLGTALGPDFQHRFRVTADDEQVVEQILTHAVQAAIADLAAAVDRLEVTDREVRWEGPGKPGDVKRVVGIHAKVRGVVLALSGED